MEHCLKARVKALQDVSALSWNFWNHSSCVSASIKTNYFNPCLKAFSRCFLARKFQYLQILGCFAIVRSTNHGDQGITVLRERSVVMNLGGASRANCPMLLTKATPLRSVWEQIGWSKAVEFADATGPTLPGVQNELGKDPTLRRFDPPSIPSPKVESYHIKKTQN